MNTVTTTDPRTGRTTETGLAESTAQDVDRAVSEARDSAGRLRELGRSGRAALLRRIADAIDASADELSATAAAETGLP